MAYIGNSPGVASQRVVTTFTATAGQTTFTPSSGYTLGYCDVFYNGVKLVNGDDYTASNGTSVVLASAAAAGDSVEIVAHFPRGLSDGYLKSEADALLAAKQNSLGYTPVNKAGDTMTGALEVQSASGSQLKAHKTNVSSLGQASIADFQITQTNSQSALLARISTDFISGWGGDLVISTKPANANPDNTVVERVRVDNAGRVTLPYQPRFRAGRSSNNSFSHGSVVTFQANVYNPTSNYNSANGRFTAPVAGMYQFNAAVRLDSVPSNIGAYWRIRPFKNGSHIEWLCGDPIQPSTDAGTSYASVTMSFAIDLAANDYIEITIDNANSVSVTVSNSGFSGYLIG